MVDSYADSAIVLGSALRELCLKADLTGVELAHMLLWQQSKVSRMETGQQLPTIGDINSWVAATDPRVEIRDALIDLLVHVRHEKNAKRKLGKPHFFQKMQDQYNEIGHEANTIQTFEISCIPGLLQTPEYAESVFHGLSYFFNISEDEINQAVLTRLKRQSIIDDPNKSCEFVICESALHLFDCSPASMLAQLDHLIVASNMPTVTIAIKPFNSRGAVIPGVGFILFDGVCYMEDLNSRYVTSAKEGAFGDFFNGVFNAALHGEKAREKIRLAAQKIKSEKM